MPWKRGPAAWKVATAAEGILSELAETRRGFFSLRRAARLLKLSTQPLRDWISRDYLKRDGPSLKISRKELCRFVKLLQERAEPFDSSRYLERLHWKRGFPPRPFEKLQSARFVWPKGRPALTPTEIAKIVGCHSSLIVKAIRSDDFFQSLNTRARTAYRLTITKSAWDGAFPFTLIQP